MFMNGKNGYFIRSTFMNALNVHYSPDFFISVGVERNEIFIFALNEQFPGRNRFEIQGFEQCQMPSGGTQGEIFEILVQFIFPQLQPIGILLQLTTVLGLIRGTIGAIRAQS